MDLTTIDLQLPEVNGEYFAGIAIGTEQALAEEERLKYISYHSGTIADENGAPREENTYLDSEEAIKATLLYLNAKCVEKKREDHERTFLLAAAAVALKTGMIRDRNFAPENNSDVDGNLSDPDGDWTHADTDLLTAAMGHADHVEYIRQAINEKTMQEAASIIVGTKVNWFKENHHVGQGGKESGAFAKKVINTLCGEGADKKLLKVAHIAGHWASTRGVLQMLGLGGIIDTDPVVAPEAVLRATDDVKLRLRSCPAGTGRLAISYALASKMLKHPVAVMCPNVDAYGLLPSVHAQVIANPAKYHLGAAYLTGSRARYDDINYREFLGRAGTWGDIFMAKSTLMKSPHAKTYRDADDYEPDFEQICKTFKADRTAQLKEQMAAFKKTTLRPGAGYAAVCDRFNIVANADALEVIKILQEQADQDTNNPVVNPVVNPNQDVDQGQDSDNDDEQ